MQRSHRIMRFYHLIAGGLFFFLLTTLPLQASEIVEVGVFQLELLGPGDSAVGGGDCQFGNPFSITATTTWSEEQKEAATRSLEILNNCITNESGRPIRIAMAWRDDLPEDVLGSADITALTDLSAGQDVSTAEAAWRDGDSKDHFPKAADILIQYNSDQSFHYGDGLPGRQSDFTSTITHEILHGLGIGTGYTQSDGFLALSRWDSLIEDADGNRPRAGTFGTPEDLTVIGPEGTVRWLGEYANATYGGQMPITTFEDEYAPGSTLIHTGRDGELMSWASDAGDVTRAPNKLLLDVLRDLGWEINMDYYNAFGATYYRDDAVIEDHDNFLSDYDHAYALYVNGDGNRIVQSGALESRGDFADTLRLTGDDNRLKITGSLTATGNNARALYVNGLDNTIFISGNLSAQGAGSVGIYVPAPINYFILSEATIAADTALYFTMSNGLYILNDSRIEGDLVAEGLRSIVRFGYLLDEEGQVTGYDPTFRFRFDDDIVGNWLGYLGAGELSLNGNADFEVLTIREQGTLKGTGTIHGAVVNQGAVAPGNSIGTLTIDGDYTHEAGAVLEVEAGDGSSDRLRITGTADLQGGTLHLIPSGYLTDGSYTFLEAGTLQGAFADLQAPAVFNAELDSSVTNALGLAVTRNSYASLGANSDQGSLGTALDAMRPAATGDEAVILNTLDSLRLSDLHGAMDDLTPRLHNSVTVAALDGIHQRNDLLLERIAGGGADEQRRRVWVSLLRDNARYDDEPESPAFRAKSNGVMLGLEQRVGPELRLGVAAAYDETDLHELDAGGTVDSLSWNAYLYGAWDRAVGHGALFARSLFALGGDSYDSKRFIPALDRTAASEHHGRHLSAALLGGYQWKTAAWSFSPRVGIEYIALNEAGFTEKDAAAANLRLAGKDSETCSGLLGLRAERRVVLGGNKLLTLHLGVDWVHAFSTAAEDGQALFVDSGEGFRIHGRERAADGLEGNLGVHAVIAEGISARLDYQQTLQDGGYRSSRFDLGLEWLF